MQSIAIDAWKQTCPQCHQDWFELDDKPLKQCPHCFASGEDIYSEEDPVSVEVYVYLDPLSGAVDVEVRKEVA